MELSAEEAGAPEPESYPEEPWHLTGHALVGVWLVPRDQAPPPHSARTRQLRLGGRVVVAAAFFRYTEPSPLQYGEVMATQLVLDGWVPRVSITHIWVDSPASRAGGRDLWAIPKDLATFEIDGVSSYAAPGIGSATTERARTLPFRLPVAFTIAQDDVVNGHAGRLRVSPVRGRARLALARTHWDADARGPLGFLARRRPVVTLALRPFELVFGRR